MTQARGGASADPDPAWWRWTHALCSTSSRHVFNVITLDLDQCLRHHKLALFFAQKLFSWLCKITVECLMLHGLFYQYPCYISGHGNISAVLLSTKGLKTLRFKLKYLNLCSDNVRRSYVFGTTSGWVITDNIFIFGWTIPLTFLCSPVLIYSWWILMYSLPLFLSFFC